jgi:hypothetical protein
MAVNKQLIQRAPSKAMQAAKRAGIDVNLPSPHVKIVEQEQADIN